MASGTPVLATHAGAWGEIITEGKDGWLAQPTDPSDLTRALRLLFSSESQELELMGKTARENVKKYFQIQHEVKRVAEIYNELLDTYGETSASMSMASNNCSPPAAVLPQINALHKPYARV